MPTRKPNKTDLLLSNLIRNRAGDFSYTELMKIAGVNRLQDVKRMINNLIKRGLIRVSNCKCMAKKDIYIKITLAGSAYNSKFWIHKPPQNLG